MKTRGVLYVLHKPGWKEVVLGLVFTVLAFVCGMNLPVILGKEMWIYIAFIYIFLAAVLPMWFLMQPRDYMSTFMFVGMIAGAVLGLIFAHPSMNLPAFTGFQNENLGTLFPILFVTVACGAVSAEKEAMEWVMGRRRCDLDCQISEEVDYFFEYYENLHPAVLLSYEREVYYSKDGSDFRVKAIEDGKYDFYSQIADHSQSSHHNKQEEPS